MTRKEIHLVQAKHSTGGQQRLRRRAAWLRFRVSPVRPGCPRTSQGAYPVLLQAKEAYPDLYETYKFQSLPQWYETGKSQGYDDQSDRDKLERLSYDAELGEGEPCDESLCGGLDNLEAQEINSLVVPAEQLPSTGNLRTECDQLVMSPYGDASDIVELRWICYLKAHRRPAAYDRDQLRGHRPLADGA